MIFKIALFIITAIFFYNLGNDNGIKDTSKKIAEKINQSNSISDLKIKLNISELGGNENAKSR